MIEVRPLSKAPHLQLLPGCRSMKCSGCVCLHCCVCAFGWVKCRAQIQSMGHGQGIFWQTVCQLRLAIGKANCGTPHLPTRDG